MYRFITALDRHDRIAPERGHLSAPPAAALVGQTAVTHASRFVQRPGQEALLASRYAALKVVPHRGSRRVSANYLISFRLRLKSQSSR